MCYHQGNHRGRAALHQPATLQDAARQPPVGGRMGTDQPGSRLPVGRLLKRYRLAAGLSQEALAERAGLSWRTISDLERGVKQGPRGSTLRLLAEALALGAEERGLASERLSRGGGAGGAGVRAVPRGGGACIPQVVQAGLPAAFPPPASPGTPPSNLPAALTSFIGREAERAEVRALLGAARLVTLTGAGGAGKTRLALVVGAEALGAYPEGVWLVELAPLADAALVPQAVALALEGQAGESREP
jgi:DNA-binding XRE family transcriptional regulator